MPRSPTEERGAPVTGFYPVNVCSLLLVFELPILQPLQFRTCCGALGLDGVIARRAWWYFWISSLISAATLLDSWIGFPFTLAQPLMHV